MCLNFMYNISKYNSYSLNQELKLFSLFVIIDKSIFINREVWHIMIFFIAFISLTKGAVKRQFVWTQMYAIMLIRSYSYNLIINYYNQDCLMLLFNITHIDCMGHSTNIMVTHVIQIILLHFFITNP